jgi:hypothetical protein
VLNRRPWSCGDTRPRAGGSGHRKSTSPNSAELR